MSFKEFIFGHPIEIILKEIENFGKKLIPLTNENLYSECQKGKAKYFKQNLDATRKAYSRIKHGEDARKVVQELYLYVKDEDLKRILEKTRRI